ncbi:MAG: CoA-binding protein, partial [Candidatus Micrarchaeota archaeon]
VIGASHEPQSVGYGILKSLVKGSVLPSPFARAFSGKVYAVNPNATEILETPCFKRITDIKENIDLAVISVPAKIVPVVLRDCAKKKVKAVVIVSAGFGELGKEGKKIEAEILEIARNAKMRLLGPNCLGIINPETGLNASFGLSVPKPGGGIAFVSQSGALADSVIDWALDEMYAFRALVSLGNSADLDAADFVDWFAQDASTKVITIYLEGIKDGRKFFESVRTCVSKGKPVIILKGGRAAAGIKAVSSHTGALSGEYRVFESAMRQAGAFVAESLEDMFDQAKALAQQPKAKKNAIVIVTNGGGAGVLCADWCEKYGVNLAALTPETVKKLDLTGKMHPAYSRANPLDLVGDALPDRYETSLNTLLSEDYISGVIVLQTLQTMTDPMQDARVVIEANKRFADKPMVCVFMGGKYSKESIRLLAKNNVPDYNDPKKAAKAMAALCGVLKW